MPTWKDLLHGASRERTLQRASSALGRGTRYVLGKGGFNPLLDLTADCDCSGFVAWCIGIPRELPPGSGRWLDTTAYWNNGGSAARAAGFPLFIQVDETQSQPGDLIVYPDPPTGGQGHIGILTRAGNEETMRVIHCSRGNWQNFGDAVRETNAHVFTSNSRHRVLRIDYAALRRYAGVPEPANGGVDILPGPTDDVLHHPLLANQPTLRRVLEGELQLQRTGTVVSGIGSIQEALNILARDNAAYRIDLGPNQRNRGVFGPKTEEVLKRFQSDQGLAETGDLDAETLRELDAELTRFSIADSPVDESNEPPVIERFVETEPLDFKLSHEGRRWFASIAGAGRFLVGRRVVYRPGNRPATIGLDNIIDDNGPVYQPESFVGGQGHWAYLIHPTAQAESSGYFIRLNTYDRAGFTFGFLQFAAHVADGDFVQYFRELLAIDGEAETYFPDLQLVNGRIARKVSGTVTPLETASSSDALKRYLNPSPAEVEDREVLNAAKFIHWCINSPRHQAVQVQIAMRAAREKFMPSNRRAALNGRNDKVCLIAMDILHQGRAGFDVIQAILSAHRNDEDAFERLLGVGAQSYPRRITTLRNATSALASDGKLGRKRFSATQMDFVD